MSVNDSLQKENLSKEREIRRLNKDMQQYERAIVSLKSNASMGISNSEVSKKDAECMAGMSCNKAECGDIESMNCGSLLEEETIKYQDRIRKIEVNLKSSSESVRALRKVNVTLSEELHALRRVCAALDEQCRAATQRAQFKDDIIREMRRQLKQAKAKLKESEIFNPKSRDYPSNHKHTPPSLDSGSMCVRRQPRRTRAEPLAEPPLHPESDDCRTPRNGARLRLRPRTAGRSARRAPTIVLKFRILNSASSPTPVSDQSIADLERSLLEDCVHIPRCPRNKCPSLSRKDCPTTTPCWWTPGSASFNQYVARHVPCIHKKCPHAQEQEFLSSRPCSPKYQESSEIPRKSTTKYCCAGRSRSCSPKALNEDLPRPYAPSPLRPSLSNFKHLALDGNIQRCQSPKTTNNLPESHSPKMSPKPSFSATYMTKPVCFKSIKAEDCSIKSRSPCPPKSCPESPQEDMTKPVCCRSIKAEKCSIRPRSPCPPNSCPVSPREKMCAATGTAFILKPSPPSPRQSISDVCLSRSRSPSTPTACDPKPTLPRILKVCPNRRKSSCIQDPGLLSPKASISEVCQARSKSPCTVRPCYPKTSPKSSYSEICPRRPQSRFPISPRPSYSEVCQSRPRSCSPHLLSPKVSDSVFCPARPVTPKPCIVSAKPPCNSKPFPIFPKPSNSKVYSQPCPPSPIVSNPEVFPTTSKCNAKKTYISPRPSNSKVCIARSMSPKPSSSKRSNTEICPLKSISARPNSTEPTSRQCGLKICPGSPKPRCGLNTCSHFPALSCSSVGVSSEECPANLHCVQFQVPETSERTANCARDVKELYFNKDVQKSDASVTWEECMKEEGLQAFESSATEPFSNAIKTEPNDSGACKFPQESGASTSGHGGVCDAARAHYYHSKLLSTLQILQNKEDTVRVQTESLNVAEQRIATLTIRAAQLRRELDRKNNELQSLRKSMNTCSRDKVDVSVQSQELETQKNLVKSLQNNLSVIEDLYRECFYETAKQEELIDMLRKSYLDVRLMEKEKTDQIDRLETVINNQKLSLERCHNIAVEVEDLKLEISNFLSNSNNDSGMWERSEASETLVTEVSEDLQDIVEQLMLLRDMLKGDCTCGLKKENKRLKELNENMNMEMINVKKSARALQCALSKRDEENERLSKVLEERDDELEGVRQQLATLEEGERDRANMSDCLALQLKQTQVILKEKCVELEQLQERNAQCARAEADLRKQLAQADNVIKENCKIRSEVQHLTQQVSQWRQQLADSEARVRTVEEELVRARSYCRNIDQCYREKTACAAALQAQLEEAHERGAQLCAEARRVVCAVRLWVRRMRARDREQEDKIKELEEIIACQQQCLHRRECAPIPEPFCRTRQSEASTSASRTVGCSKCAKNDNDKRIGCSKCAKNDTETPRCSKLKERESETVRCKCGGSEKVSCQCGSGSERASSSSAPVRPRRLVKKKKCDARCAPRSCEASIQEPLRNEAGTCPPAAPAGSATCCRQYQVRHARLVASPTRAMSPSEELFERVERLQEAVEDGQRRWSKSQLHRR